MATKTTSHGRVYDEGRKVRIDWTPPAPVAGYAALTGGVEVHDPKNGPVVQFREKHRGQTICARITPDRPELAALAALARELKAELEAEETARSARLAADRLAEIEADIARFAATLPAGYVRIAEVRCEPGAADGWGLTTYRHGGVPLSREEIEALDVRPYRPLGAAHQLVVFAPADRLTDLVARKRSAVVAMEAAAPATEWRSARGLTLSEEMDREDSSY